MKAVLRKVARACLAPAIASIALVPVDLACAQELPRFDAAASDSTVRAMMGRHGKNLPLPPRAIA